MHEVLCIDNDLETEGQLSSITFLAESTSAMYDSDLVLIKVSEVDAELGGHKYGML